MAGKIKTVLKVGDCLGEDVVVANHICAELCDANANFINKIVKNKIGSWHAVTWENKIILPEIKGCPYCLKKLL